MSKPIEFLIEHRPVILQAYEQNRKNLKKTWDGLRESLPELSGAMTFATFKQYLSVLVAFHRKLQAEQAQQLSKLGQENLRLTDECSELRQNLLLKDEEIKRDRSQLSGLSQKIHLLSEDLSALQMKVDALKASLSRPEKPGRNIAGWTVRLTSKGYYHLCKSFGGRVKSIYLGKVLDEQKARQKINEYVSKLG